LLQGIDGKTGSLTSADFHDEISYCSKLQHRVDPRLGNGTIESHPNLYVAVKITVENPGYETITGKARRENLWV
jgi:hypothetical protein